MDRNQLDILNFKLDLIGRHMGLFVSERVASVMVRRFERASAGDMVTCVDYYPPWNRAGTFGKDRVCVEYMDHQWQIKRFEEASGLVFSDLPVTGSAKAVRRVSGKHYQNEVKVKRPFSLLIITPRDGKGNEKKRYIRSFVTHETAVQDEPSTDQTSDQKSPEAIDFYSGLTQLQKTAYKTTEPVAFMAILEQLTEWDEPAILTAVSKVFDQSVVPMARNFEAGQMRVAILDALQFLSGQIRAEVNQNQAIVNTREKFKG